MANRNPGAISKIFNRFAGKEINIIAIEHAIPKTYASRIEFRLGASNPVLDELEKAVKEAGLELCLRLPNWRPPAVACDYNPDRLNVHIELKEDGKYRISPTFHLG